jgi:hypothetical protein
VWSEKFPWAKLVVDAHGKAYQVKCNMYTKIEGKEKFLAPKLNNHWKHNGKRKALIVVIGIRKLSW